MKTYTRNIEGRFSLPEITRQVRGEEAGASKFVSSVISGAINSATFETTPAGTVPNEITFLKRSDAAPPGTTNVWAGEMIVSNKKETVAAYRKE
jgi:hypothetical protein